MNMTRIPLGLRRIFREAVEKAAKPINLYRYFRYLPGNDTYLLPKGMPDSADVCQLGLPIPPKDLWLGYGDRVEDYLSSGAEATQTMMKLLEQDGFTLNERARILDFGCGAGRMMRHLKPLAEKCEIWGVDISAPHIFWARQNLSPQFKFVVGTTEPHLPFADGYFDLIYCGSVFTHIDDLADTWLCELRRVLSARGRLYVTIHDNHTMDLIAKRDLSSSSMLEKSKGMLFAYIRRSPLQQLSGPFGMLVVGRYTESQVFYDTEYFVKTVVNLGYRVCSITPEGYGYQTVFVLQ